MSMAAYSSETDRIRPTISGPGGWCFPAHHGGVSVSRASITGRRSRVFVAAKKRRSKNQPIACAGTATGLFRGDRTWSPAVGLWLATPWGAVVVLNDRRVDGGDRN